MRNTCAFFAIALGVGACSGGATGDAARRSSSTTTASTADALAVWRWLVYASRKGDTVVVSRRPLGPGDSEVLFSYPEPRGQGTPDVGASADGRLVGYITGGVELHLRDDRAGTDAVLVSGHGREPPPNVDAIAPRWSVENMNHLSAAEEAECPECGLLAIGGLSFSPSGDWVAFGQHYYEGGNWGFIERATGRYETSGDAGGDVFWKDDKEVVTIGAFYGEEADVRMATLDALPISRVVSSGRHRDLRGSLSPAGDRVAVIFDEPPDRAVRNKVGVLSLNGGDLATLDTDDKKLSAGFAGDETVVWVERRGLSGVLLRPDADPVPLPDDLYSFSGITPTGPDQIGFSGARRPACTQISDPCEGPTPLFQQRYLIVNIRDGSVVWQSPGFNAETSFAGITS